MLGFGKKENYDTDAIVVRNCSTIDVLERLKREIAPFKEASGRYCIFDGAVKLSQIRKWGADNGFYVKDSRLGPITMVDIMVDRKAGGFPSHGELVRRAPRARKTEEWAPRSDDNNN